MLAKKKMPRLLRPRAPASATGRLRAAKHVRAMPSTPAAACPEQRSQLLALLTGQRPSFNVRGSKVVLLAVLVHRCLGQPGVDLARGGVGAERAAEQQNVRLGPANETRRRVQTPLLAVAESRKAGCARAGGARRPSPHRYPGKRAGHVRQVCGRARTRLAQAGRLRFPLWFHGPWRSCDPPFREDRRTGKPGCSLVDGVVFPPARLDDAELPPFRLLHDAPLGHLSNHVAGHGHVPAGRANAHDKAPQAGRRWGPLRPLPGERAIPSPRGQCRRWQQTAGRPAAATPHRYSYAPSAYLSE